MGDWYYIGFIDDHLHWATSNPRTRYSEARALYQEFEKWAEYQAGRHIQARKNDCGGEYLSDNIEEHLISRAFDRQFTIAYFPYENEVPQQIKCTPLNLVRSMLGDQSAPKYI